MSRKSVTEDLIRRAAKDKAQIRARRQLSVYASRVFETSGIELYAIGNICGSDRVSGKSPYGNGSDEIVAISLLMRICAQLIIASSDLTRDGRVYAAAALIRQMVEVEYLAWAFHTRDNDAERWLRSDSEERRKFFTPAKLRAAADGKFRGKDYGYHCELGGHPVPTGAVLLQSDTTVVAQLMLSDMLGHAGRIWDHLLSWSATNEWVFPMQARKEEMYRRFSAWKSLDGLAELPPPP